MATLNKNGVEIARIEFERVRTDGADADPMTCVEQITYSLRSNGVTLKRNRSHQDYGFGSGPQWYGGGWKRAGKIKAGLVGNVQALREALQAWAEAMFAKGWTASFDCNGQHIDFEQ